MNHARGRDRREARSLGRGARTLIGVSLTLLLLAMQAQFIAGAKQPDKEKKGTARAESSEAPASDAPAEEPSADEPLPAEEPSADPAPAEEPAEEPPADEAPPTEEEQPPAPDPSGDDGSGGSADGGDGAGETGTPPDGSTDSEGPATDGGGATTDDGEARLRRLNGFRAERALPQQADPDPKNPMCSDFGLLELTRFDPVPSSGSVTQNGVTITITGSEDDEAVEFSWTSQTPVDLVIVKAGPGASLYTYDEATSDSGLTGPQRKGISHISFCYDVEEDEPDVEIEKSANLEADPAAGDTFSYTITITNVGTGTAEGVEVTDTFPAGLSVDGQRLPEGCSLDGNTVSCDLGDIEEGEDKSVTIWVTVDEGFCGELANTAEVTAENDTNPENNTSNTVTLNVECEPDVAVEKSAVIEGNPRPGDTFDFSITVSNVGTGTAEDVVLTDLIQAGLAIEGTDPGPPTCMIEPGALGETVTCAVGDIPQGESVTVTITVTVEEDFCGPIENTAEVTSPSDSNSENDSDTVTFEAECQPDVSVSKSAEVDGGTVDEVPSGSSFTYVITVTNNGTGTAEGVTLSDDLDDSLQNVTASPSQGSCVVGSGNTLSCDLGDIPQGESVTVTITVTLDEEFCGELLNQATVNAENDSNEQNNQSELISVDVPCGPDIAVRKTNDADTDGSFNDEEEALHEGDAVTFEVVITNTGNVAIQLDSLLDEYEGTSINPDCLTAEGQNVLGVTLQPGESVTCYFTVEDYAPEPNGEIVDVVTVVGHDVQNPENTVTDFDDSTVTTPQVLPEPPIRPEPPPPGPPPGVILPVTGAELGLMGLVALALVLAGIVLSYLGRREDESET